jgi:putative hydrolase of the HAD superfamily
VIRLVFFDIGGVLLEIDPERTIRYWSARSGVPAKRIRSTFPVEVHHRYERGQLSDEEFFRGVKQALPQPNGLTAADFWDGWRRLIGGETGAVALLHQLTTQVPVWLLSNTNPRHIRNDVSHRFSFFQAVAGAVYSYEVGYRKPEPGIYRKALELTGRRPEECLFIDDVAANVAQAREIGFHAIRYVSAEDLKPQLRRLGFSVA